MCYQPRRRGFTLIELLVVMVTIAVLATIAVSLYWHVKDRSIVAVLQSDLRVAALKQDLYFAQHHAYATDAGALEEFTHTPGVRLDITFTSPEGWAGVASHPSVNARCGLMIGNAPAGSAGPAIAPGMIRCE